MFKNFRFSNKEPCPCNSGVLYKDCCKNKKPRTFRTQGEMNNLIGKQMKKSRIKMCLYPSCKSKGIKAHALQENRILNKLEVNKEVLMQDFTKDPTILEIEGKPEPFYFLEEVNIKDATVANCFCKTHDDAVFAKIEKSQYTLDTLDEEQLFLFAYKTFSFEYYTEIVSNKYHTNIFKEVPQLTKNPITVHKYRNNALKLEDLQYYKEYFDKALLSREFSGLETIVIELPYRIQFANYMTIAPPFDLKGKKIKSIDKKTKRMKFIFFTTYPVENKSYILISAVKEDMNIYGQYFEQLRTMPIGFIQYYINVFVPLYSQNLILSPALWDSWAEEGQIQVQYAVAELRNAALLKGLQFGLQNIAKSKQENIDSSTIKFNFFIE